MDDRLETTITVTREVEALIQFAMAEGAYATPSDAIRAALLASTDELLGYTTEELRRLGDEGEASGPSEPFDPDEIKHEIRRTLSRPDAG